MMAMMANQRLRVLSVMSCSLVWHLCDTTGTQCRVTGTDCFVLRVIAANELSAH
jgi:hypothetical protein